MIDGTRRLLEQESSKPRSSRRTLGRLLRYFRPFWRVLAGVVVMMGVSAWGQAVTPELLGQAVDCYLTPAAALSGQSGPSAQQFSCWFGAVPAGSPLSAYLTGLGWLVAALAGLFVLGSISSGLMFYWMSWAGQQILRSLQVEVFGHLHSL
jgi:ATP-binding cassette, subfamily B, multidrug efflux pump